jgi:hypothetical protein
MTSLKRIYILFFGFLFLFCNSISAFSSEQQFISSEDAYLKDSDLKQNVYYQNVPKAKLPVVFLAHNGDHDGTAWGDFPQQIANAGFFAVNITYRYESDVSSAIEYTLEKYADKIDTENVSFVGGCHGALMLSQVFTEGSSKYTVKNFVMLSLAEMNLDFLTGKHPPVLAYYSLKDELGEGYASTTKMVAADLLSAPKKVVANTDPAHGDGMVVKAANKDQIRKDIIEWLRSTNSSVSSSKYKVDNTKDTIAIGKNSVSVLAFKNNIKGTKGAVFTVLKADGKTAVVSGNMAKGMKLKVLAADKKTFTIYSIIQ